MATDPAEGPSHEFDSEEEGGPVKSFLEHLEDLRWMLIKSGSAIFVAVLICLLAGNYIVGILLIPLHKAPISYEGTNAIVTIGFGTNHFGSFLLTDDQQKLLNPGTNRFVAFQLAPIAVTNGTSVIQVLALQPDPNPAANEVAKSMHIDLANLGPADAFMTAFHVAIYAGIALASPFIFYFVAQFVFPALKMNEKKYIYRGLVFGLGLFLLGVCFCYFVLMPYALAASQKYAHWLGFSSMMWKAEDYIGFVSKFMLGMGLGFEMPVVILVLVKLGILNYRLLSMARPYMVVINLVLGAVLTTPEVFTQVLMAVPLQFLYEISVWITYYWERKERTRRKAEGLED